MSKQYFGTDGIRGKVGVDPITPDFMLKLGWAVGKVFSKGTIPARVLIGKDTRISGYMFESVLEAGLSAAGTEVLLLGPMPTPAIAYLTRTFRADVGIVISASHNPHDDNGIKFFCRQGKKLSDSVELEIESMLAQPLKTVGSELLGKARRVDDAGGRYIEFCKSTFGRGLDLRGLKIVLDCANGATYHVAPGVFRELGASVSTLAIHPDGLNINLNCGSTQPEALQAEVLKQKADLGIAFDGDGDRVIMVDSQGNRIDGDQLLYVLADHRYRKASLCGGVVGTLMSNLGLERGIAAMGAEFVRARVGDRYVMEQLESRGWLLGGESSGHLICLDRTSTGDGVVAALQVLQAIVESEKSLDELVLGMQMCPQKLINVRLAHRVMLEEQPDVLRAVKNAEASLAGKGRILLRLSGTEPVLRVMVEGEEVSQVEQLAMTLADDVRRLLAS
ncbi:MAG: phosphoglucosamine mutase [Gammaproteobacteria bacterium]